MTNMTATGWPILPIKYRNKGNKGNKPFHDERNLDFQYIVI